MAGGASYVCVSVCLPTPRRRRRRRRRRRWPALRVQSSRVELSGITYLHDITAYHDAMADVAVAVARGTRAKYRRPKYRGPKSISRATLGLPCPIYRLPCLVLQQTGRQTLFCPAACTCMHPRFSKTTWILARFLAKSTHFVSASPCRPCPDTRERGGDKATRRVDSRFLVRSWCRSALLDQERRP
jgi:hypothetical protein